MIEFKGWLNKGWLKNLHRIYFYFRTAHFMFKLRLNVIFICLQVSKYLALESFCEHHLLLQIYFILLTE